MRKQSSYYRQVQLLLRLLPIIAEQPCFALKGGTAINLFYNDLPRLSIDIDLTYLPVQARAPSLEHITVALQSIAENIERTIPNTTVEQTSSYKLLVSQSVVLVKVEVNAILRGVVHSVTQLPVSARTEDEFGYAEMQVVSSLDLYAGKLCAALDRQHPRDLFDVYHFLENQSITTELLDTFLVYLISHNRPINEVLFPNLRDISADYNNEFLYMAEQPLALEVLEHTRQQMISQIHNGLTARQKSFLLSFKSLQPDWNLLPLTGIDNLPAIRWKQQNLYKMQQPQHAIALYKLRQSIEGIT